eukprot:RCo004420
MQLVPHHGVVGWMAPHFYPPNHRSHPVERIFSLHRRFLVQTLSFFSILLLCGLLPLPTPTQRMFLPDLFLPPLTLLFLLFLSLSFSFFHLMFHGQSGLV